MEPPGIYRERNGWETNTVPALDMTNTKSLIYRKVVTVKEVTSRPWMSPPWKEETENGGA